MYCGGLVLPGLDRVDGVHLHHCKHLESAAEADQR